MIIIKGVSGREKKKRKESKMVKELRNETEDEDETESEIVHNTASVEEDKFPSCLAICAAIGITFVFGICTVIKIIMKFSKD